MTASDRRRLRKMLDDFARQVEALAVPLPYVERALERVLDERTKKIL